ncbi:cytochrome P450 [Hyalangium rubrum]|uniref:Cytochrome P450 n=1 Tax=Hyalangium rubrum TaxID=3103134 RepID=A0ABU5H8D8_9BACT|nr:cytochrome P450 [Hyalangium sp. s54d21]MDY7229374.1 cytochrome P450 [Hyalangium sp. s54d21]
MPDSTMGTPGVGQRLPPRVPGLPLVGNLPRLLAQRFDFLEEARRQAGELFLLDLGLGKAVALCHPRHAQHVLVDRARNYTKGGPMWDSIRSFLGNGLPVSEGEFWKRQRRMIQPAFHHQRLVSLIGEMVEAIDACLEEAWEPAARTGEPFDAAKAFTRVTMNVLVRALFGSGLEPRETEQVAQAFTYVNAYMMKGLVTNSLPPWVPVPGRARYREAIRTIDEIVFQVLARGRRSADTGDSLISLLLHATDEETGKQMTDAQLRDEAVALFVAGYETTAASMAWAFHFLSVQPETAQRLHAEVDAVLGSRKPGFEDLRQLTYTRGVLQEALRMYPPSYWIPRTAEEDDELDGYRIPAGTQMAVLTYVLHHHPEIWESPQRFEPERFTPERSAGRHKHAWIPFGSGQRQCIGKEFSLMEGQLILARVAQRFQASAIAGRMPQVQLGGSLNTRNGVWVRLKQRQARVSVPLD